MVPIGIGQLYGVSDQASVLIAAVGRADSSTRISLPVPNAERGIDIREAVSRAVAAILGGYLFANASSLALASILPLDRGSAVMTSALLSFAFYCAAIIGVFVARSTLRAWIGIVAATSFCGVVAYMSNTAGP